MTVKLNMRVCWNRQTGTFEGRVSYGVRVQVPSLAPRRSKLYIACSDSFSKVRAHSCRCSSSPNRTRCTGLRFGFGCRPGNNGIYTVSILHDVIRTGSSLWEMGSDYLFSLASLKRLISKTVLSSTQTLNQEATFEFELRRIWS